MAQKKEKKEKRPKETTAIQKENSLLQPAKPSIATPIWITEELLFFKKVELKKVAGRLIEFKHIKLREMDDAGRFCIWVELIDTKSVSKKFRPLRLTPHVAPHALNRLTGYFEDPGNPIIINVEHTQRVYLTFATIQKNYRTAIKSCTITYVVSAPPSQQLSLRQIKKYNSSSN